MVRNIVVAPQDSKGNQSLPDYNGFNHPVRPQSDTFFQYVGSRMDTSKMSIAKKLQFFLVTVICTGILVYQSTRCVQKYLDKDTGTADKYDHVSKASFPVMTICPTYPYNLDRLNFHGIPSKSAIQFGAQWVANDSMVSPIELYQDVVIRPEFVVKSVLINAESFIDGKNNFDLKVTDTFCGQALFKTMEYYYNGDCFALEPPGCLRGAGILEIVLDFYNKTDIFIHHQGQFLSPNSRSRVDVDLGTFVKIAVNHEVVQLLDEKSNCVNDYGEDADYDMCMYSQMRQLMLDEVGCTVPWMPDKTDVCTKEADRKKAFDLYQKNRRNQNDLCPNSCLFTNMYFGPPVTGKAQKELADVARAVFYFRRDIKSTTEYFLYSTLSMLAEIGGYVGLLMGISLLKLAEVNNVFLDYIIQSRKGRDGGDSGRVSRIS